MYVNPNQFFTSEREFLLGALIGKLTPELSLHFPTLQDVFHIKESGSKFKTKAQKLAFIKQISDNLKDLPYNPVQSNNITEFLRNKATKYGVPFPDTEINAHFVKHSTQKCNCKECHELTKFSVSNSILGAYDFVKGLESSVKYLKIPEMDNFLTHLNRLLLPTAKSTISSIILDKIIEFCTSSSDMYFDDLPLFVFQYNMGNKNLSIQFDKNEVKNFYK